MQTLIQVCHMVSKLAGPVVMYMNASSDVLLPSTTGRLECPNEHAMITSNLELGQLAAEHWCCCACIL